MRQARPDDVLDAVAYVTGYDPCNHARSPKYIAARRLAVAALREICELSYVECAKVLGYADHTGVVHHARGAVDHRLLSAVIDRTSADIEIEEAHEAQRLAEARRWL
jgi:chromosomal replication initiation ATPase DnaA